MAASVNTPLLSIGVYDVLDRISEGSICAVLKGCHRESGELVAIKMVMPIHAGNQVLLQRFGQESRVAASLCHPNLVRALDSGQEDGLPYLVMEFVEGQDLWTLIEARKKFSEADAVALIVQVALGLHFAHKSGVIHRDVKPDHILVTAGGKAKLTGLGLVKDLDSNLDLTKPAKGLGTPNFIAPEQFSNAKHADARCDIYSLGATLYMMVTGELPFEARTLAATLKKKLANDIPSPRQLDPDLSERIETVILRSMRADPNERYRSCPEFMEALLEEASASAAPASTAMATDDRPPTMRASQGERRASVRFSCNLKISCNLMPSLHGDQTEDQWQATVKDLSVSGVGLLLSRRFEPGTILTVELQSRDSTSKRTREITVTRVKPGGKGQWLVGGKFHEKLSKEDVKRLL